MFVKRIIDAIEKSFLVLIAIFTVGAMLQEVILLFDNRKVELKDLLLMFIYAEAVPPADHAPPGRAACRGVQEMGPAMLYMLHGNGAVICILEGTAVAGAWVGTAVLASGAFTSVESTELITMGQMVEGKGSAGAVAAKFRPPGK